VTVADATDETLAAADAVTFRPGGHGAVREVIDALLAAQNKRDTLLRALEGR